jgi:hypothetical protein
MPDTTISTRRAGGKGRLLGARAMIALASLLLVVSILATWIRTQIIDTSGWTRTSVQLLHNEKVRRAVSGAISERLLSVIDARELARLHLPPALAPVAGVLSSAAAEYLPQAVDGALAAPPIQKAWGRANQLAHAELIRLLDGGGAALSTTGGVVSIDLGFLLDRIGVRLGIGDQIGARLPPGRRRLVLLRSKQLKLAQDAVKGLRDLSLLAPALVLLCYLAALGFAAGRRRALLEIGVGIVIAALVSLLLHRLLESYVTDALVKSDGPRPAVREALAILTASWRSRAIWVLVTGAVVLAAGIFSVRSQARHEAPGATEPEDGAGETKAIAPEAGAKRANRLMLGAASGILILVIVLVLVDAGQSSTPPPLPAASTAGPELCNGLAQLCSRRLDQVVFPATHNSFSASDEGFLAANQATGIGAQLAGGIRGLLIDTHVGVATAKGVYTVLAEGKKSRAKVLDTVGPALTATALGIRRAIGYRGGGERALYLCHAFCELGATPARRALEVIRDFLRANPGEVLLISVEDDTSPASFADVVAASGLLPYVWKGAVEPPPTLGQMVARNERVLFMAENETGSVPWLHPQFTIAQETPYDFKQPEELLGPNGCAANRGGTTPPLFLINNFLETFPPSKAGAETLNRQATIVAHARACEAQRHRVPTLIAVDQWQLGNVVGAARELNEAGPGTGS